MEDTPRANRLHIGIFGRRNGGKSSFINALTNQNIAIVSDVPGTTADPVYKSMEVHPLGPCVIIDTAGFDDDGELGSLRVKKTKEAAEKCDIAMMIFTSESSIDGFLYEKQWYHYFKQGNVPVIAVVNKEDIYDNTELCNDIYNELGLKAISISSKTTVGIDKVIDEMIKLPLDFEVPSITGHLVHKGDSVLLVMPQDIQAPRGRLILPQVQVIRDLLDIGAIPHCCTTDKMEDALEMLKEPPKVIITDSQVFKKVYDKKPKETKLTSFSMLMARYKGDIDEFLKGAHKVDSLKEQDKVLIAEACAHNPLDGDIGRIKIPNMLKKIIGEKINIEIVSGNNFPEDLSSYALVIHCGGCMFNRKYMLSRIMKCKNQGIPITNYGVFIAKVMGILEYVTI